jgi:hypothetical protein
MLTRARLAELVFAGPRPTGYTFKVLVFNNFMWAYHSVRSRIQTPFQTTGQPGGAGLPRVIH